ncbi:hypothetical protein N9B31_08100 [Mariniblastus sp.]|nr:hypothetical protein [Mariniblastus sp.]MDA7911810.1 hypothetical protein [bacterium]MDA7926311.1 hypothetical protein [Mariniblastus sp.]MDA7928446.1 hypothetical protein [Mariniblastus sp.]MDA9352823.1 hypothetical protein [bacterium]
MNTPPIPPNEPNDENSRCVVLFHQGGAVDHWDLMLEVDNTLWTWHLEELPAPDKPVLGERIPDHRTHYLDYEGLVSNNRGTVNRVRSGQYRWIRSSANQVAVLNFENESWNLLLEDDKPIAKISFTSQ